MSSPEPPIAAVMSTSRHRTRPPMLSPKTPHRSGTDFRSSSPNYFGLVVDPASSSAKSAGGQQQRQQHPQSRTPSSASVHAAAAAAMSPHALPVSSNPEFDQFKKQLELNRINLSNHAPFSATSSSSGSSTRPSSQEAESSLTHPRRTSAKTPPKIGLSATTAGEDIPHPPRSPPKRGLSSDTADGPHRVRRQSPADFNEHGLARSLGSPPLRHQDRTGPDSFLSPDSSPPGSASILTRISTVPASTEPPTPLMLSTDQIADLLTCQKDQVLLLDMRVSTQYAQSRICGALNLCIPTTLLKRPSYNVHRLADTFKADSQKDEFARWRSDKIIIVYDNASSQMKEAHSCVNILKKFASEGWTGQSLIVRGGFAEFSTARPDLVDDVPLGADARSTSNDMSFHSESLELPPVMGGCPLPETENAANPFFGNIRQNMDLIDGVGQIAIKCPQLLNEQERSDLPAWLRDVADDNSQGKRVADKFLRIEKREKARMEEALSGQVVYGQSGLDSNDKIKVAGIEKGTKNRYHNIIPFEHSRVKLKGVPKDGCDYVNANFLSTSVSRKKYIATQSPIPATFGDFWKMVWQRDIRVVVMLTAETEGNQIKAHNYWNSQRYGSINVQQHSEHRASVEPQRVRRARVRPQMKEQRRFSSMLTPGLQPEELPSAGKDEPYVVVRKFTISHEGLPFERMREVTQLHFSAWPDFGVPPQPSHLLGLMEQCNSVVHATSASASQPSERPVLVHCSAGCGRTGTFCTVDSVVDALKHRIDEATTNAGANAMDVDRQTLNRQHQDLVEKAVDEFRLQRLSMVQSLDQFVYCYEAVLEWIAQSKQPPLTA